MILHPIETDEFDPTRQYIPLPGGWEIQTKGKGSSYRLLNRNNGERQPILGGEPKFIQDFVTQMALDVRKAVEGQPPAFYVSAEQLDNLALLPSPYLPFRMAPEGKFQTPIYRGVAALDVQPMETAPKDGTWIKLLIDYSAAGPDACPLEDSAEPGWTLGSNNFDNTEVDEWSWMGWDWSHDCIRETRAGKPIGWAPFHERSENGNKLPVSGKVFPADLIAKLDALCSPAAEAMSDSERLTQLVRTGQEVVKELSR